uniref:Glycosyltransferase n=1 Tax=Klebsiella pneumoniae TaxID=573 RepID=A0A483S6G1_KLEPN
MKYYIAIPTYNGGDIWREVVSNIKKYSTDELFVHVIDSGSVDSTKLIAEEAGFDVTCISSKDFNHGGTRNQAVYKYINEFEIVIFLTQDAIPEDGFIDNIISVFKNEKVACAYGRQLPHFSANPLAQHARAFNYPNKSYVCGKNNVSALGLKSVFMSNSFSAYRLSAFKELEGFPSNTILCEDMFYAAKAILAGYQVAYAADAVVRHSHNYKPLEEFKRYFDIGVFHAQEKWIREKIGGAGGEGKKFILSEMKFLVKNAPLWIPLACINNCMKFFGYKLGQNYASIPLKLVRMLSMHKRYWS